MQRYLLYISWEAVCEALPVVLERALELLETRMSTLSDRITPATVPPSVPVSLSDDPYPMLLSNDII